MSTAASLSLSSTAAGRRRRSGSLTRVLRSPARAVSRVNKTAARYTVHFTVHRLLSDGEVAATNADNTAAAAAALLDDENDDDDEAWSGDGSEHSGSGSDGRASHAERRLSASSGGGGRQQKQRSVLGFGLGGVPGGVCVAVDLGQSGRHRQQRTHADPFGVWEQTLSAPDVTLYTNEAKRSANRKEARVALVEARTGCELAAARIDVATAASSSSGSRELLVELRRGDRSQSARAAEARAIPRTAMLLLTVKAEKAGRDASALRESAARDGAAGSDARLSRDSSRYGGSGSGGGGDNDDDNDGDQTSPASVSSGTPSSQSTPIARSPRSARAARMFGDDGGGDGNDTDRGSAASDGSASGGSSSPTTPGGGGSGWRRGRQRQSASGGQLSGNRTAQRPAPLVASYGIDGERLQSRGSFGACNEAQHRDSGSSGARPMPSPSAAPTDDDDGGSGATRNGGDVVRRLHAVTRERDRLAQQLRRESAAFQDEVRRLVSQISALRVEQASVAKERDVYRDRAHGVDAGAADDDDGDEGSRGRHRQQQQQQKQKQQRADAGATLPNTVEQLRAALAAARAGQQAAEDAARREVEAVRKVLDEMKSRRRRDGEGSGGTGTGATPSPSSWSHGRTPESVTSPEADSVSMRSSRSFHHERDFAERGAKGHAAREEEAAGAEEEGDDDDDDLATMRRYLERQLIESKVRHAEAESRADERTQQLHFAQRQLQQERERSRDLGRELSRANDGFISDESGVRSDRGGNRGGGGGGASTTTRPASRSQPPQPQPRHSLDVTNLRGFSPYVEKSGAMEALARRHQEGDDARHRPRGNSAAAASTKSAALARQTSAQTTNKASATRAAGKEKTSRTRKKKSTWSRFLGRFRIDGHRRGRHERGEHGLSQ